MLRFTFALFLILLFATCGEEVVVDKHVDHVIGGNIATDYDGVSSIQVKSYINRLYIDLLGEEPSESELNDAFQDLNSASLSIGSRENLIDELLIDPRYFYRLYELTSQAMIQGVDSMRIIEELYILGLIQNEAVNSGDLVTAQLIEIPINKLQNLASARADYQSGSISINEFYRRFVLNTFYDDINMGSENFSIATFENLFKRSPTTAELLNAVDMVDNQSAQLFQFDGDSKGDFVDIMTHVDAFYEGLVIGAFNAYLGRDPSSVEMGSLTAELLLNADLRFLQKAILKSDEYAGF